MYSHFSVDPLSISFQKGLGVQEGKKDVIKVDSLVQNGENYQVYPVPSMPKHIV